MVLTVGVRKWSYDVDVEKVEGDKRIAKRRKWAATAAAKALYCIKYLAQRKGALLRSVCCSNQVNSGVT